MKNISLVPCNKGSSVDSREKNIKKVSDGVYPPPLGKKLYSPNPFMRDVMRSKPASLLFANYQTPINRPTDWQKSAFGFATFVAKSLPLSFFLPFFFIIRPLFVSETVSTPKMTAKRNIFEGRSIIFANSVALVLREKGSTGICEI